MTMAASVRDWLLRPADTFAGRGLILVLLAFSGPLGVAVSCWYLVTGHVHGGRLAAVALLGYATASTVLLVRGCRAIARIWHLLAGVLLIVPLRWVDSWVTEDRMRWRLPGFALLLVLGLAYNLSRFVWRVRKTAAAVVPGGPADAVVEQAAVSTQGVRPPTP